MGGQLPLWRTMGHRLSLHCPSIPVGNNCSKSPGHKGTARSLPRFPEPRSVRLQTPKAGAQGPSTRHTSCPALGWRLGQQAAQMTGDKRRIITDACCRRICLSWHFPVASLHRQHGLEGYGMCWDTEPPPGPESGSRTCSERGLLQNRELAEQARLGPFLLPRGGREDPRLAEGGCPVASSSWGPCLCSGFCHCLWPFPWKP